MTLRPPTHFEERSLQRQWGHLYEEYRERVGTIVHRRVQAEALRVGAHDWVNAASRGIMPCTVKTFYPALGPKAIR